MERREQSWLVRYNSIVQLPQLLEAELQGPRGPGLKEGALVLYGGSEIHNQLGESSFLAYKVVKHASLAPSSDVAARPAGASG